MEHSEASSYLTNLSASNNKGKQETFSLAGNIASRNTHRGPQKSEANPKDGAKVPRVDGG